MDNTLQNLPLRQPTQAQQIYAYLYGNAPIDPTAAAAQPVVTPDMTVSQPPAAAKPSATYNQFFNGPASGAPAPNLSTPGAMSAVMNGRPLPQAQSEPTTLDNLFNQPTPPLPAAQRAGEIAKGFPGAKPNAPAVQGVPGTEPGPASGQPGPPLSSAQRAGELTKAFQGLSASVPSGPGVPSQQIGPAPALAMPTSEAIAAAAPLPGTEPPRNPEWDFLNQQYGPGGNAPVAGPPTPPVPLSTKEKILLGIGGVLNPMAGLATLEGLAARPRHYQERLQEYQRDLPAVQEQANQTAYQHMGETTEALARAQEASAGAGLQTAETQRVPFEMGRTQMTAKAGAIAEIQAAKAKGSLPDDALFANWQQVAQANPFLGLTDNDIRGAISPTPSVTPAYTPVVGPSGIPEGIRNRQNQFFPIVSSPNGSLDLHFIPNDPEASAVVQTMLGAHQQGRAEKRVDEGYVSSLAAERGAEASARTSAEQERLLQLRQDLLTAPTRTMMESAPLVKNLAAQTEQLLNKQEAQLGPLAGRWNDFWTGKVGAPNPEFKALQVNTSLLRTQLMKMHVGSRGSEFILQEFANMLDASKDSPENLRAALQTVNTYADSLIAEHQAANANLAGAISAGKPGAAGQPAHPQATVQSGIQVQTKDGLAHSFPDQKSADAFKQAAKAKGLL